MTRQLIKEYLDHGWSLVPIPPGTKGPKLAGWNTKLAALRSAPELPDDYGVGLGHAYSKTMAFDIDSWEHTSNYGIDLEALYAADDAVIIESGKVGHGKLLYQMPFGLTLPSKKVTIEKVTAFELRCGTSEGRTVQDLLPPSIHPETLQPYRWTGKGHWKRLPMVPQQLLSIWYELLKSEPVSINVDGVDASWDEIQDALGHISADCTRDEWINVGMALQWAGSKAFNLDQAFHIWNTWSQTSLKKYPGERAILGQWHSFRSDKGSVVTLGTMFHIARRHGWVRATLDASILFTSTEPPQKPEILIQDLRPQPPDADLQWWPKLLVKRAMEVGDGIGCDPLIPLMAGLAAVCGVADAQTRLELMPGFQVPPILWLMTIGKPSDKKSPGSYPMLEPIAKIQKENMKLYNKAVMEWEGKEAAYSKAYDIWIKFCASPEAQLGAQEPLVPPKPEKPVSIRITVSDITSQKLVRNTAERPRGLLCHLDEMYSWCKKLTDKSSGEDRSAWVKSYESKPYEMERVGAGSIYADNHAVSIYGNIQPEVYREFVPLMTTDGLLQRFVPAVLRADKSKLGNPIPEHLTSAAAWENLLRLIFALQPMTYKMTDEAYSLYRSFQGWYERMKRDEVLVGSGNAYMTAFGKLEGLLGRLILVFHLIEKPFSHTVDDTLVMRAIRVMQDYIIPSLRHTLGEIGGATALDLWVTDYIIQRSDDPSITMATIRQAATSILKNVETRKGDQMILSSMHVLEQSKWVGRADDGDREQRGVAVWYINPSLKDSFREYREEVIRARQRIRDKIWQSTGLPARTVVHGADELEDLYK